MDLIDCEDTSAETSRCLGKHDVVGEDPPPLRPESDSESDFGDSGMVDESSSDEESEDMEIFRPGLAFNDSGPMSFRYPDGSVSRYNDGKLVLSGGSRFNQIDPATNRFIESGEECNHPTEESATKLEVGTGTSGLPPLSANWPMPPLQTHATSRCFGQHDVASGCLSFGPSSKVEDHNSEVARIIDVLGSSGVGRRAVLPSSREHPRHHVGG